MFQLNSELHYLISELHKQLIILSYINTQPVSWKVISD